MKTPGKKDGKEKDLLTVENWVAHDTIPKTTRDVLGALIKYLTMPKLLTSTPGVVMARRFTSAPEN